MIIAAAAMIFAAAAAFLCRVCMILVAAVIMHVAAAVSISCVATRELVCKDFCLEREEALVKRAAHLMVASLAGSLALVTSREPLRVALTQHLRQLLQPASTKDDADQVNNIMLLLLLLC